MDVKTVRSHLEEVQTELAKLDERREVFLTLLHGYEAWLRVFDVEPETTPPAVTTPTPPPRKRGAPTMKEGSFNSSVLQVIRQGNGAPLHAKEILRRVRQLGNDTQSKDPVGITDLVAHNLAKHHPMRKVAGRTWAWIGGSVDQALLPEPLAHVNGSDGSPQS